MREYTIGLLLVVFLCANTSWSQYTVKINIGEIINPMSEAHPYEWVVHYVTADIFDSEGNLVPPSDEYWYNWEMNDCDGQGFHPWSASWGRYSLTPDGHNSVPSPCGPDTDFQVYFVRVTVTIDGQMYSSEQVRLPDNFSGVLEQKKIKFDQRLQDGSTTGFVGRQIDYPIFNFPAPLEFYIPSTQSTVVLRASQEWIPSSNEKYFRWSNENNVKNPQEFVPNSPVNNYVVLFHESHDAAIQAVTSTGELLPGVEIKFKDPWLIDTQNTDFGNSDQNQGMNAPFKIVQSGDLGINSIHKGIFLDLHPGTIPFHYSLKTMKFTADEDGIYQFAHWTGEHVEFTQPSGLESDVIFTDPDAIARAVYSRISDQPRDGPFLLGGSSLTIPAGANIVFHPSFEIWVWWGDTLQIEGTESNPVILTSAGPEKWQGIRIFNDGTFDAKYTRIEHAERAISLVYESNVTFEAQDRSFAEFLTFEDNVTGVFVEGGAPESYVGRVNLLFEGCTFEDNGAGIEFESSFSGTGYPPSVDMVLANSTFIGNGIGIKVDKNLYECEISNSQFIGNQTGVYIAHGISDASQYNPATVISQNVFQNNVDGIFLELGGSAHSTIRQNTLYQNDNSIFRTDSDVTGTADVYNNIAVEGESGIFLSSVDKLHHNLVWNMSGGGLVPNRRGWELKPRSCIDRSIER